MKSKEDILEEVKSLFDSIEKYVTEPRQSIGEGWAEITDKDLDDLAVILHKIIEFKCAPDADGDRPIQFELINRTKERKIFPWIRFLIV